MRSYKFWLIGFASLASLALLGFYLTIQRSSHLMGKSHQKAKAELIQKKLDQFAIVSNLISSFVQEDLKGSQISQASIEKNLIQYLNSSPSDIIFGIGIWFQPYAFDKKTRLFGPYVHRPGLKAQSESHVITYEWNTDEYNYPTQEWYNAGLRAEGKSIFVEPYFDSGLVYVTNSRVFYNSKKEALGVISVDMILPQLQDLVTEQSRFGQEHVYLLNRSGHLLAHPLKEAFFKKENIEDGKNNQSLLNFKPDQVNASLGELYSDWIRTSVEQKDLGWQVVVESSPEAHSPDISRYRKLLLAAFAFLWSLILGSLKLLSVRDRERRMNNEKLEKGRSQLIQSAKMAALGEMASGVAHEINNPLAIIVGKVHSIERILKLNNYQSTDLENGLQKIKQTAERIGKIVSGLRTFSRSGEHDPFSPEELRTIVEDSISLCSERFRNHGIILSIGEVPDIKINCRMTQISQVFLNLLSNAFDAVQTENTKEVSVIFKLDQQSSFVNIEIVDSGPGIPENIAKNIMQPFFTTKEVGKGTGLGLSISSGIIEEHKGRLYLDQQSESTKFVISLPYLSRSETSTIQATTRT